MTICMAAICHDQATHYAVVAADRMVTLGNFMEFEHGIPKMAHPAPHAVVLVAGDSLVGARLAKEVSADLDGAAPRTIEIARQLAAKYQQIRLLAVETQLLAPRGLNLEAFYAGQQSMNPQITMMIDQGMSQFNLNVELLLAGVDQDGAHLFSVHNPGGSELQHDFIGHMAVGSGAIHAVQSMVGFRHTSGAGLRETIFRVYASKRRAEVAPGVGQDTDIAIVSLAGVRWIDNDNQKELAALYETYQETATSNLAAKLSDLKLGNESPEDRSGTRGPSVD